MTVVEVPRSAARSESPWVGVVRSLLRHRAFVVGGTIVLVFVAIAVFAPLVAPYDPAKTFAGPLLAPPSPQHLMGTDDFGRDIFSRVVFGSRSSLLVGLFAVLIAVTIGTSIGLVAGYNQRRLDSVLMRTVDVLLAFPGLMLALALAAVIGTGFQSLVLAVGIAGIPNFARVVRSAVVGVVEEEYVLSARSTGCRTHRIILVHVLPNVMSTVIVVGTLYLAFAVLGSASLSFLGVGIQPPTPEWGAMTSAGRSVLVTAWWVSTFPGLMIVFFVLAVNIVGDALRDALDSTLRHI